MFAKNKTVAFIPVRGGSKSIPKKNIREIAGQPLVYWAIDAAVNCTHIDRVFVSTDCDDIKNVVLKYKKKNYEKLTCIGRSSDTATDLAETESAMIEFANKFGFEDIILLQATSPLLKTIDLTLAIEKYKTEGYDSLLSVVNQKRFIWEIEKSNSVTPLNYDLSKRPRRQEQEGFLVENGAFYITKKELLLITGTRISGNIGFYQMSEETYFEIDEDADWMIVEGLLKRNVSFAQEIDYENIKLFAMDCDGVLTDAGMYYSENEDELKKFNTRDGMGIQLLHQAGIRTAIITGENTNIVKNRAKKMGVKEVYQGVTDKVAVMDGLLKKHNLSYNDVAYVGDDINDLELLKKVKYNFSVNDAIEAVKNEVHFVTKRKGGNGAVREIVELILSSGKK